ncbi:MAG: hypothetical protein Q9216_004349 [Gyalolechia sp. 2 TL-2023]
MAEEVEVRGQDRLSSRASCEVETPQNDYMQSRDLYGNDAQLARTLSGCELLQSVTYSLCLTFLRRDSPNLSFYASRQPNADDDIGRYAEQRVIRYVQDTCPHELVDKELHFRTGTALVETVDGRKSYDLSRESDWNLQRIIRPNYTGPVHVEIHREYIALRICAEANKTFANTKRDELASMKCKAADRLRYFPRLDVELIASCGTIAKMIAEDTSSAMDSAEKEGFANTVYHDARALFTSCIHAQLDIRCLKRLIENGWNDGRLKVQPLEEDDLCHEACRTNFDNLLEWQKSFRVAEFLTVGHHQDFDTEQTVPFQYCPNRAQEVNTSRENSTSGNAIVQTQARSSDKDTARCGSGPFSEVFRVKMDPSHHKLAVDKDTPFAVKVFGDCPLRRKRDFAQELKVLEQLQRYPHAHIVTHLATWTQNDKYYMLSPYATCNLRRYMANWQFKSPQRSTPTLWILAQLRGLADALCSIHNLFEESKIQSPSHLSVPARTLGYHHDLKPENVLFFSTQDSTQLDRHTGEGSFRVADLGSVKMNTLRIESVNARWSAGTATYAPPEQETEGLTSRPYDIWSMGCIFLELLVWALFDYDAVRRFSHQRHSHCEASNSIPSDAFWIIEKGGHAVKKHTVTDQVNRLRGEILRKQHLPFDQVLRVVEDMLIIDSRKRIDAVSVWNRLDQIYKSAVADFEEVERVFADVSVQTGSIYSKSY